MSSSGLDGSSQALTIPEEMVESIENVGLLDSIPLWIVTLLGSLLITVLSFIMILTVYGRMFNGYIGWALTNYGGYSLENALEFSQQQAAAHGWSGYGDPEYVPHVQRYYSGGNLFAGLFGNQQIVTIAKGEIGASDGQKYWSWYGFSSYQEWCACFVSWCGEQAGLIESGAMPRFSLCSDGMSWFQSQGKWQAAGSTPTAGSLVFFDWGGDGVPDHVAIVEKCENGIVYTVEGNTSTRVNGESVRGVWQHQYPVSDQSILGYGTI